jgi:hypothetical protein
MISLVGNITGGTIHLIPSRRRMPCYRIQDNVFGKAGGKKPYGHTATTDNAAQKLYLGFYNIKFERYPYASILKEV